MESLKPVVEQHATEANTQLELVQDAHRDADAEAALIPAKITTLSNDISLVKDENDDAQSTLAIAANYRANTAQENDYQRALSAATTSGNTYTIAQGYMTQANTAQTQAGNAVNAAMA